MYHNFYNADKTGKIGIVLNSYYTWPKDTNNTEDVAAADRNLQFWVDKKNKIVINFFYDNFRFVVGMVCTSYIF